MKLAWILPSLVAAASAVACGGARLAETGPPQPAPRSAPPPPVVVGCQDDTQCKADRTCSAGSCVPRERGLPAPAPPIAAPESASSHVAIRTRTNQPVACNRGQTNTPCIFKKGQDCFVRHMNCENLPCTESAPEPSACDRAVAQLKQPTHVCLDVRSLPHDAIIDVFQNDSNSENGTGPFGDSQNARICGSADRVWRISVTSGGSSFESEVDWRRASCFSVDLATHQVSAKCEAPGNTKNYENRL